MYRSLLIKLLTLGFAGLTLYYLAESIFNIFYFYPQIFGETKNLSFETQRGILNKAIYSYFSLIVYSFISLTFLTSPEEEIKDIHLVAGVLIFIVSLLFFKEQLESHLLYYFILSFF